MYFINFYLFLLREDGSEKPNKWEHDGDSEEKKYECQFSESSLTDNIRNKEVSASVNSSWLPHQQVLETAV